MITLPALCGRHFLECECAVAELKQVERAQDVLTLIVRLESHLADRRCEVDGRVTGEIATK
jgi:hypothetical protein